MKDAGQQPKRNIVHAGKRHIRCADQQWYEPVSESADQRWHDREENHDQPVRRDNHVIGMAVGKELKAWLLQFRAYHDGEHAADQSADHGKGQVHGADVFVVGGLKPAHQSGGSVLKTSHRGLHHRHLARLLTPGLCEQNADRGPGSPAELSQQDDWRWAVSR